MGTVIGTWEHGNMERAGPSRTPPIWLKSRAVVQTTELGLTSPPELEQKARHVNFW